MPEIAGGNVGSQSDVPSDDGTSVDWIVDASTCAPQSPSPPFPPSPSDGVLSGSLPVATSSSDAMWAASSNSSRITVEDLLSESPYSSAPSPCSSGSYNRADFPFDNEIEEFMSPSFEWPPSSSASIVLRQDSSRLTDVVQRQSSRRQLLYEVREKSDRLLVLLKELPRSSNHPYTKASALVTRKSNIIRRVSTIIPTSSIVKVLLELENAIENVSWLVKRGPVLVLPPIAEDEPYFMFEYLVDKLLNGSPKDQATAATELGSLDGYRAWVQSLINLLNVGKDVEMQEKAAKALGSLSRAGPGGVDVMVQAGICYVFTKVLNEGAMKVQAMVAWAVSELASHHPQCQDDFAENNAVEILVGHLAFETFQGQRISPELPVPKPASIVLADSNAHIRGREQEDPATKSRMKAMAAKALSALAKGNPGICNSIIETRALLAFVVLLQKGTEEVRSNSAVAVMEIARVAEADNQIMRFAFRVSSPTAEAVVNQLLQIVWNWKAEYNDLLVPSIVALGCMSTTFLFGATQTRLIRALIRLLYEQETDVMLEAVIALTKFAETDASMRTEVCKAIIDEGGVKHLVELVHFGEHQKPVLFLLRMVAPLVPDSHERAELCSTLFNGGPSRALFIEIL